MSNEDRVLIHVELDTDEAIKFLVACKEADSSVDQMLQDIIKNFLACGDNHLTEKSA